MTQTVALTECAGSRAVDHTELRGAVDALEQRKWHPEGPGWAWGVGLCKPQGAQQEPEQGAAPGSGQAPVSTQAGWIYQQMDRWRAALPRRAWRFCYMRGWM